MSKDRKFEFMWKWLMTFGTNKASIEKRREWYDKEGFDDIGTDSTSVFMFFDRDAGDGYGNRWISQRGLDYIKNNGGKNG